ncbi:hypothetical protein pEaSNUABM38_00150 [Erwinia phage pEa_SNUABM_38]|nr:hypothetical protein pEaSNUABM38_00150 [Erwinia phage pEa_SNUABM_38]
MATLQEEFIGMINAKNPNLGLALSDVEFGNPTNYAPTGDGDTRNTALVITAKADSPNFTGSKEYHFFRFNFTHPNGEDEPSSIINDAQYNWDSDDMVLSVMNASLPNHPVLMSEVTIVRTELAVDENQDEYRDIKLTFSPNHLKWQGSYVFRVYTGKDVLAWKNAELDGFV